MNVSLTCACTDDVDATKSLGFYTYNSITAVSEAEWNKLIPEANVLMQYDYLLLLEGLHKNDLQFYYVVVKNEDVAIGALYFQVVKFEGAQLLNYFPEQAGAVVKALKGISALILRQINVRLLVSGNVFMTGENGFYFSHDVPPAQRGRVLRRVVRQLLRENSKIKAVLISDLYKPATAFDEGFLQNGYNELTVESDMTLQLRSEWKTFEDYLNSFSSKYRVRAKKVFALCEENGVEKRELNAEEILLHQQRLFELYNKVMGNADFKLATLAPDYFYRQKLQLPQQYRLFGYFRQGQLIGFISAFHIGKKIEVHYTGMDHDLARPIHLYQHMMYDMIGYGIENHAAKLHFGRTAPEIKSTIGAVPSKMYGYLKHRNFLFNRLLAGPYTAYLKPKQYVIRSPFK